MKLANGVTVIELQSVHRHIPSGYYMDIDGNVWSTRSCSDGTPAKLAGTSTRYGRYFKLGGQFFPHDDLVKHAKQTPIWNQTFLSPFQIALCVTSNQELSTKPVKGGYVIATVENGILVFGSKPRVHTTLVSVKTEMSRLAHLKPGVTYVSLKIEQLVTASQLVWS